VELGWLLVCAKAACASAVRRAWMLDCTSGWLRSELMFSRLDGCLGDLNERFRGGSCFEMSWRA